MTASGKHTTGRKEKVTREARGARREGREGLKVARCTLNVGRQRGGVHRHMRPHWHVRPRRVTPQCAGRPTGVVHPPGGDRHIRRDHRCASRPPPITAWPISRRTIPANRLSGTRVVRRAHTTRRRCNVARRRGVQRAALRCHQA